MEEEAGQPLMRRRLSMRRMCIKREHVGTFQTKMVGQVVSTWKEGAGTVRFNRCSDLL
jgi:hypothetical protein